MTERNPNERREGETTDSYISRRAWEIQLEQAPLNDPFIDDETHLRRVFEHVGLIPKPEVLDESHIEA